MAFRMIHLAETTSTNSYLHQLQGDDDVCVWADHQTAGRGCGTNTWESEGGKNLLFSVRCHPEGVPATRQFLLLEAMALAVRQLFDCCDLGERLTVKWPNDIYWRDRKLAGTLSECMLSGQHIRHCIIGTGLNLNQTEFRSDAPNPVSVAQIRGTQMAVEDTLLRLLHCFEKELQRIAQRRWDDIHSDYCHALYRREGFHRYRDQAGTFSAAIKGVEPDGHLVLLDSDGLQRRYAFKEVAFVL